MFYTVYKTTNLINGKFYVGAHKTSDPNDSYLGSGTLLKRAIEKYGVENFKKEVLFIFDNLEAMFAKEAEIVTAEFLAEHNTYNLKVGGFGGFHWINANGVVVVCLGKRINEGNAKDFAQRRHASVQERRKDPEYDRAFRSREVRKLGSSFSTAFLGKTHTPETKAKIGEANSGHQQGVKNSQFGSMWITDGTINKKIKKGDQIPEGWKPGRVTQ